MALFARESGPVAAPAILFLHGAEHSGQCWQPVVDQLPQYRCLFPDLPRHGEKLEEPFGIDQAASAVAELIRSRVPTGRVHLVGHSLGAQVGAQLLATEPALVDRAVLCGTLVNTLPGVWLTRNLLGAFAGLSRSFELSQSSRGNARPDGTPEHDHGPGVGQPMSPDQISEVVWESAGFTIPGGLDRSESHTLFLTGDAEPAIVHLSASALRRRIPNGVEAMARGMRHNWPLHQPVIFARTVDSWLTGTTLPNEIVLRGSNRSEEPQD